MFITNTPHVGETLLLSELTLKEKSRHREEYQPRFGHSGRRPDKLLHIDSNAAQRWVAKKAYSYGWMAERAPHGSRQYAGEKASGWTLRLSDLQNQPRQLVEEVVGIVRDSHAGIQALRPLLLLEGLPAHQWWKAALAVELNEDDWQTLGKAGQTTFDLHKAAKISVRDEYIDRFLMRYRHFLNVSPLPSPQEKRR